MKFPIQIKIPFPKIVRVPEWPPQDWQAWAALIAGIAGGAALTGFAMWVVWLMVYAPWPLATAPQRVKWLGWGLMLLLSGVIAQLLSQGLAINRREIEITRDGIKIKGGRGPAAEAIDKATTAASNLENQGGQ